PASFTATAATGYRFAGWTVNGSPVGGTNPLVATVTQGMKVQASFGALPVVGFASAAISGVETQGKVTLVVQRQGDLSMPSTVTVQTADGSAVAGVDYVATNASTLSFGAGEATQSVDVTIVSRAGTQGGRSFTVNLSGAADAVLGGASATVTIQDAQAFGFDRIGFPPQALLTLRQDGAANEVVVNLGSVDRFYSAAVGSRTVLAELPPGSMVTGGSVGTFNTLDGVRLSVLGAVRATATDERPLQTLWATRPRVQDAVIASPWARRSQSSLGLSAAKVANIGVNAAARAAAAEPGPRNTATLVAYSSTLPGGLGANLGTAGNLSATMPGTVEAVVPAGFASGSGTLKADFFEVRPGGGDSQYLGYFELSADGTLAFVVPTTEVAATVA
ncbi:MAG: hypothetical protein EBS42_16140, partial [Caulobacteraceae bacterium]|nr:hypothetical protein [Caulobacteraceae bacterium]